MLTVSPSAQEQVKAYFSDKDIKPIRIFVSNGCGGAQLTMALDDITVNDQVFTHGGIDYIMETSLLEQAQPVKVDFNGMGFSISSKLELGGGCGSCGSTGSCCS